METELITANETTNRAGRAANQAAADAAFGMFRITKAANTLARHDHDLAVFAKYLAAVKINTDAAALASDPQAWRGITWGLVAGFVQWALRQGYAVGTVGVLLTTVRVYSGLAFKAGAIDATEHALIGTVKAYGGKQARHVDQKRADAGMPTRKGAKKATATTITLEQARTLKTDHADTPAGRRDRLMFCLLINLGLRVGELVALRVDSFNLADGAVTFYREKVGKVQTHALLNGTWEAARRYISQDCPDHDAPLLRGSRKGGALTHAGITRFAVAQHVADVGARIGLSPLSPHDCRHYWATNAANAGTGAFALRDAGGWATMAMPSRYVEAAAIANQGVVMTE